MADATKNGSVAKTASAEGASPYATGGGGVTLERRVAVLFLARLLTGATAAELRGRRVWRVAFQQAPAHRVDDLVVTANRDDGTSALELNIAVRRAPAFVKSEKDTQKLFGDLLASDLTTGVSDVERRLAICVAGPQRAAQQVGELAALAEKQTSPEGFFELVQAPRKFDRTLRNRLDHLANLVKANLAIDSFEPSDEEIEQATWQLLRRLDILMPRLEPDDEADWIELINQLEPWARDHTIAGATALRDRLESLAAGYSPAAADVDLAMLRRDAHEVVDGERRRRAEAWEELRRLHADAVAAVRLTVGVEAAGQTIRLPRPESAEKVRTELRRGEAVLVSGESGVGKSALVVSELNAAGPEDSPGISVVCLNLRMLPSTMSDLRDALGAPLEDLLGEMSAPIRILVLDAADVTIERDDHMLAGLLRAASSANVVPWVVSASNGSAAVRSIVEATVGKFREITVEGLDDSELQQVVATFPQLRRLVDEPRAKELLRRPAIVDLFVRSGSTGLPLSEADAFDIAWTNLIRAAERTSRGLPDARDQAMRLLAAQQLRRSDALTAYAALDASAVAGLQHDGLLRKNRWGPLPTFAHELVRTYATARVLLSVDDLVEELLRCDAPRWALPAVRLAIQIILARPNEADAPLEGRFVRLQTAVDRIVAAGHGDRWADLPSEAVLSLPGAAVILNDAWPALIERDAAGVKRLLRVIQQRHGNTGMIDGLIAEPLITLLFERGRPSGLTRRVDELLSMWLRALVLANEPIGHPLRIALRARLVGRVEVGDAQLLHLARERAAQLAARTPEQVAADKARAREARLFSGIPMGRRLRRRVRQDLPHELTDDDLVEKLALLGADLGEEGATLLRRLAAHAPHDLAPAVDRPLAGMGLASHSTELLTELVEAYYIEERDDDYDFSGIGDDGIRRHHGSVFPLTAFYRGPFLALFRADLMRGVACLNRMLNHAARTRVRILRRFHDGKPQEPDDTDHIELDITGDRRRYLGDGQVWMWYRATGVGPLPCTSALLALELVCDQLIQTGARPDALARLLLKGCDNLAMPALVYGMLVRNLENAGTALDPFLSEPAVWHLEFGRVVQEHFGIGARTEGIRASDRRTWDPRSVAMQLALSATSERAEALVAVGRRLVNRAAELEGVDPDSGSLTKELAAARAWAGALDRNTFRLTNVDRGYLVEQVIDDDVLAHLAPSNAEIARGKDAMALVMRHRERFDRHGEPKPPHDDLIVDLATARSLANHPPSGDPSGALDAAAAVAAAALEARFRDGCDIPLEDLLWAAALLVGILNGFADESISMEHYTIFGRGPDRSAARALPLLILPAARDLRTRLLEDGLGADAINRGIAWIVENGADETRLFLTRGLDASWASPCDKTAGRCHHLDALAIVEDTARDAIIGPWDAKRQQMTRRRIEGPVTRPLESNDSLINVPHLTATIRGASAAAASSACCHDEAVSLLGVSLKAYRRGMRASKSNHLHSANDAIAVARAVLNLAASGNASLLFNHLDDFANRPPLLSEFLRALVAAGEESDARAAAARQCWPAVLARVVELARSGVCPHNDHDYGPSPLAAVIPEPSSESEYVHREFHQAPVLWADPVTLAPHIDRWLPVAAGRRDAVDALVHFLGRLPVAQQAQLGLPWMEQLVMPDPATIAKRTFLLAEWLQQVRPHATSQQLRGSWDRIVDALTVAEDSDVARLAD